MCKRNFNSGFGMSVQSRAAFPKRSKSQTFRKMERYLNICFVRYFACVPLNLLPWML